MAGNQANCKCHQQVLNMNYWAPRAEPKSLLWIVCSQSIFNIVSWVILNIIIALERELVGKLGINCANKMKRISFSFKRAYFFKTSVQKLWKQPYLIKQMLRNLMFSVEHTWFLPSVFLQLQSPYSKYGKKESWLVCSLTNIFCENCHLNYR